MIFKGFNFNKSVLSNENELFQFYHMLIESFKHAYSIRGLFGDENFENMTEVFKL